MLAIVCAAALAVVAVAAPVSASASDEAGFVGRINAARAAAGLDPLEIYWDLKDDARRQTAAMIDAGEIFHSSNLAAATSGWWALGENVGVGADVDQLHDAFMASAPHRANILGDYNYIGVGADRGDDGYLYVTVIFMKGPDGLVSPPPEETDGQSAAEPEADEAEPVAPSPATVKQSTSRPETEPEPEPEPADPDPRTAYVLELAREGRMACPRTGLQCIE
jgi:hypothetical protein